MAPVALGSPRTAALGLRQTLRFQRGSYARVASVVIALALGVALVCAMDLVNRSVLRAFVEVVDTMAGRAALQVTAGPGGVFPEDVAVAVARVPGVDLAVPVVSASAFLSNGSGELLTVHGVDITNEDAVRTYEARDRGAMIDDPLVFLNQPDSIALTRAFATRHHLQLSDPVQIMTPAGARRFTVRALLEPTGVARVYGGNLAVMDLFAAEAAFTEAGFVNRLDVVIDPGADVVAVRDGIAAVLPPGLQVDTPVQRKADLNKVMQSLQIMLQALGLIALVAAFLIAFSRLATAFEARAWQLGVLRAIGVRAAVVRRELLKESVLLGLAGVIAGIPLGTAVGRLLLPVVAATTALNFKLVAPEAELTITLPSLLLAAALGLAAAVLAALLPAWRAARVSIAESVRGRGLEQRSTSGWRMSLARLLVVGGAVAALVLQSATRSASWGMLATGCVAVAIALAAQPLLGVARHWLLPLLLAVVGPPGRFAAAALTHNARRSAMTAAMVGVGIGSILWLRMLSQSFEQSLNRTVSLTVICDLVIDSSQIVAGYMSSPLDDRLRIELSEISGVAALAAQYMIDWHHSGGPIAVHGFDPIYFATGRFGVWELVGDHLPDTSAQVAAGDAVLVSTNLAQNIGVKAGDVITLETPSGPLTLPVAGVTVSFSHPRGTVLLSRDLIGRWWRDRRITSIFVQATPGTDLDHLRLTIAGQLGEKYGVRILSAGGLAEFFASQVRRAFAPFDVLTVLILAVLLVGVTDTLAAGVIDRTRDIGTMRAIGVPRRAALLLVMAEGGVLGMCGVVLAVVGGLALGAIWVEATFPYLLGWALQLHVPYGSTLGACVIALLVCTLAAVVPARRAARLDPAVALRYE